MHILLSVPANYYLSRVVSPQVALLRQLRASYLTPVFIYSIYNIVVFNKCLVPSVDGSRSA